jgi:hypothetical protein
MAKIKVTMIQDADGQVRSVKFPEGATIPVVHAGPAMGFGKMNFTMTVEDVEIAVEMSVKTGNGDANG